MESALSPREGEASLPERHVAAAGRRCSASLYTVTCPTTRLAVLPSRLISVLPKTKRRILRLGWGALHPPGLCKSGFVVLSRFSHHSRRWFVSCATMFPNLVVPAPRRNPKQLARTRSGCRGRAGSRLPLLRAPQWASERERFQPFASSKIRTYFAMRCRSIRRTFHCSLRRRQGRPGLATIAARLLPVDHKDPKVIGPSPDERLANNSPTAARFQEAQLAATLPKSPRPLQAVRRNRANDTFPGNSP